MWGSIGCDELADQAGTAPRCADHPPAASRGLQAEWVTVHKSESRSLHLRLLLRLDTT